VPHPRARRRLQVDSKTPAAGLRLFVSGRDFDKQCTTDAKGVLLLDPAPSGSMSLSPKGGGRLDPVEIPAGRTEHAVTLTLTAAK
jgi:hypothetical protein